MNTTGIIRKKILFGLLKRTRFVYLRGHWVYSKKINNNSIVVDLGANKGEFSLEMKKMYNVNPIAVEANKVLCEIIMNKDVKVYNYAICNRNEELEFNIYENDEASSLIDGFQKKWKIKEKVKVQGVDWTSFLKISGLDDKVIDIVKIDIEGAEIELIKSLSKIQLSNIKQITVEFHDWLNPDLHLETVKAIKKIIGNDFKAFTDAPSHSWPVEMIFINKNYHKFSFFQKLFILLIDRLSFLKY
jgi:FkbM family methyltransferase